MSGTSTLIDRLLNLPDAQRREILRYVALEVDRSEHANDVIANAPRRYFKTIMRVKSLLRSGWPTVTYDEAAGNFVVREVRSTRDGGWEKESLDQPHNAHLVALKENAPSECMCDDMTVEEVSREEFEDLWGGVAFFEPPTEART
jgi:hypothetical protein